MLVKCPECQSNVSDQAINCPICGYPIKKNVRPTKILFGLKSKYGSSTFDKTWICDDEILDGGDYIVLDFGLFGTRLFSIDTPYNPPEYPVFEVPPIFFGNKENILVKIKYMGKDIGQFILPKGDSHFVTVAHECVKETYVQSWDELGREYVDSRPAYERNDVKLIY